MLDPAVRILTVADAIGFDPVTTLPTRNKIVTYMVGAQGPFRLVTPADKFTADYVEAETGKEVATLRAIGALPPV